MLLVAMPLLLVVMPRLHYLRAKALNMIVDAIDPCLPFCRLLASNQQARAEKIVHSKVLAHKKS